MCINILETFPDNNCYKVKEKSKRSDLREERNRWGREEQLKSEERKSLARRALLFLFPLSLRRPSPSLCSPPLSCSSPPPPPPSPPSPTPIGSLFPPKPKQNISKLLKRCRLNQVKFVDYGAWSKDHILYSQNYDFGSSYSAISNFHILI